MNTNNLFALSPIDGRYRNELLELEPIFSEFGLIYYRLLIEVEWFKTLAQTKAIKELKPLKQEMFDYLDSILENFDEESAANIKTIEAVTKHDVKAVEYYLKEKLSEDKKFKPYLEFVHFALTSDDVNNLAYAMMLQTALDCVIGPKLATLTETLEKMAQNNAAIAMLSHTHGQPATPTTFGKELANFVYRLVLQLDVLFAQAICGKCNGAVGNFNAHVVAYPNVDWINLSQSFVENLGLTWNPYTTQIEQHDYIAAIAHNLIRINNILIDLCRDLWGYNALGYFTLKINKNEVGSSTMPHKVNPIDLENAEGNLGIANALFDHFANKLPISRWQRDLSDSTVMRNLGVAFAHSLLAYNSIFKGLNKLEINKKVIASDLDNHWEILAEAIQTVMRRFNITGGYEELKAITRGKQVGKKVLHNFIRKLQLPKDVKERLLKLTPQNYLGYALELTKQI